MKSKQQIQNEIAKLQENLKEIENQELLEKSKDYSTIKYKGKEFRLYIWENKKIGDLKVEGFEIADFQDAVELYDNDKLVLEVWKPVFVKHYSKKQQSTKYGLSRLYLYRYLNLLSYDDDLADSNEDGRVLLVKTQTKQKEYQK